tara:strand:- start:1616 stop:2275 length:660 start_codon:yes stop_codon:yes gene_type:complete
VVKLIYNAMKHTKKIGISVWLCIILILFTILHTKGISFSTLSAHIDTVLRKAGWLAPVLYILLYMLRPITFFPATILTVLAGAIFGGIYGSVYTIIAATASAVVTYGIGNYIGKDGLKKFTTSYPKSTTWLSRLQERGFLAVLLLRLAYAPFDIVGYIAGAAKVRLVDFIIATSIGIIPGTISFVLLGSGTKNTPHLVLAILFFIISIGTSYSVKKKQK